MKNVKALIAKYKKYAKQSPDLADMYKEDAADFKTALKLSLENKVQELETFLRRMDTSPREAIVEAFYFDCGNDYVESIGYEMTESWKQWARENGLVA